MLSPDQFKRYHGNPDTSSAKWSAENISTRELVRDLHGDSDRMNRLIDKGHGEGWDLGSMDYEPGKYAYSGHMALMVRDVAFSQRSTVDALAAKGIKMPIMDMMDTGTRDAWVKRRKSDI